MNYPKHLPEDILKTFEVLPEIILQQVRPLADKITEIFIQEHQYVRYEINGNWTKTEILGTKEYVSWVTGRAGEGLKSNKRIGIEGSLSRISIIEGSFKNQNGVKIRIGRFIDGIGEPLRPHLEMDNRESKRSTLIIGAPNTGKTTLLRGLAVIIANTYGPDFLLMDTNGEITGSGSKMHGAFEGFTRQQVADPKEQAQLLAEGIKNLSPKFIMLDELDNLDEIESAVKAKRKGSRLMTTIHGEEFGEVLEFEINRKLLGDVDLDARKRRTSTIFTDAVLVLDRGVYSYIPNLTEAIDGFLAGQPVKPIPITTQKGSFVSQKELEEVAA